MTARPAAPPPPDLMEREEEEAVWAHVIRDPDTHEPALLSDEELAAVNEAIHDLTRGNFLDRAWIRPGPLLSDTEASRDE